MAGAKHAHGRPPTGVACEKSVHTGSVCVCVCVCAKKVPIWAWVGSGLRLGLGGCIFFRQTRHNADDVTDFYYTQLSA